MKVNWGKFHFETTEEMIILFTAFVLPLVVFTTLWGVLLS